MATSPSFVEGHIGLLPLAHHEIINNLTSMQTLMPITDETEQLSAAFLGIDTIFSDVHGLLRELELEGSRDPELQNAVAGMLSQWTQTRQTFADAVLTCCRAAEQAEIAAEDFADVSVFLGTESVPIARRKLFIHEYIERSAGKNDIDGQLRYLRTSTKAAVVCFRERWDVFVQPDARSSYLSCTFSVPLKVVGFFCTPCRTATKNIYRSMVPNASQELIPIKLVDEPKICHLGDTEHMQLLLSQLQNRLDLVEPKLHALSSFQTKLQADLQVTAKLFDYDDMDGQCSETLRAYLDVAGKYMAAGSILHEFSSKLSESFQALDA
ncbi:hypothetical protein EUX98_g1459 [Antrodiella citrinella]|uniref:Uncharacterized protein n=1 Tax=Antrodiella citrinella TaxID=2447956 RepID=A0A4S4N4A2_9APHY|nr:hypothetical protein EUX98_g1459 [Antrodiella citrinella]